MNSARKLNHDGNLQVYVFEVVGEAKETPFSQLAKLKAQLNETADDTGDISDTKPNPVDTQSAQIMNDSYSAKILRNMEAMTTGGPTAQSTRQTTLAKATRSKSSLSTNHVIPFSKHIL